MGNLWEQLVQFWQTMDPKHRTYVIVATVLTAVSLVVFVYFVSKPEYVLLYANLYDEDINAIAAKLDEEKIRHREQGKSVYVALPPGKSVYAVRAELAKEGLPSGGGVVGLEIFDQPNLMATDLTNKIQYQRALQGELTKAIRELAPQLIKDAKVILNIPDDSLFLGEERNATASVTLKLPPGKTLDEEQVRTIVNLVAFSVKNLKPENVTVVGNLQDFTAALREDKKTPGSNVSKTHNIKFAFEKELENKILEAVGKVYKKVIVRVNADLDLDYREINKEIPLAKEDGTGYIISRQENTETYEGKGKPPKGSPGTDSNILEYSSNGTEEENSVYERTETITNYELGKEKEYRIVAPGSVKRLTASIWIDGTVSPEQEAQITDLVAASIGFDNNRGDRIEVQGLEFAEAKDEPAPTQSVDWEYILAFTFKYVIPGLPIIVGTFLLLSLLKRSAKGELGKGIDIVIDDNTDIYQRKALTPEEQKRLELQKQLESIVQKRPQDVATLIKSWLSEE